VLIDFQCALADLTASPELCRQVRKDPEVLNGRYDLTPKEWRRLVSIVRSDGMAANCMLYRANRLAPIALNLPDTCTAIGDDLSQILSAYWDSEPITDVHFLVETDRFCHFLRTWPGLPPSALAELDREGAVVASKLEISRSISGWEPRRPDTVAG
jgi:hypothetical protein